MLLQSKNCFSQTLEVFLVLASPRWINCQLHLCLQGCKIFCLLLTKPIWHWHSSLLMQLEWNSKVILTCFLQTSPSNIIIQEEVCCPLQALALALAVWQSELSNTLLTCRCRWSASYSPGSSLWFVWSEHQGGSRAGRSAGEWRQQPCWRAKWIEVDFFFRFRYRFIRYRFIRVLWAGVW